MKKIIFFTILLFLGGCGIFAETYTLSDVTKEKTITLHKKSSQGNITGISIIGEGQLDGTAQLILILNNKPYKIENLSGHIDFQWGGDWYSDTAVIQYKPATAKDGNLILKYRFKDLY